MTIDAIETGLWLAPREITQTVRGGMVSLVKATVRFRQCRIMMWTKCGSPNDIIILPLKLSRSLLRPSEE